ARCLRCSSGILSGVRRIIQAAKSDIKNLIGNAATFVDDTFGLPTVTDILRELEKPGRDPRPAFKAAVFKEGVETLNDLAPGMILEGVVTNASRRSAPSSTSGFIRMAWCMSRRWQRPS